MLQRNITEKQNAIKKPHRKTKCYKEISQENKMLQRDLTEKQNKMREIMNFFKTDKIKLNQMCRILSYFPAFQDLIPRVSRTDKTCTKRTQITTNTN